VAISTVDDIAAGIAAGLEYPFLKVLTAAKAIGSWQSGWLAAGYPGAGSAPPAFSAGSGYTCSRTTAGALGQTNASAQNWLAKLSATSTVPATLLIYDRLWSCGGMGFAAGTYTVTTPGSLPARITDSGVGVEAFVEQFVTAGAASGTLTFNYLDTGGAAGVGTVAAVVSSPVVGQLQPIPLAVGDTGVSQVTSVVTSATWSSGSFGITLAKRVAAIPLNIAGLAADRDWAIAISRIPADACLMFAIQATATTAATLHGELTIIDK
jgi:hypothetical protein